MDQQRMWAIIVLCVIFMFIGMWIARQKQPQQRRARTLLQVLSEQGTLAIHDKFIYEYPGDVFVVFDPTTDGACIMGATRYLSEARRMLSTAGEDQRQHQEECAANGSQGCVMGPHGPDGETQCAYCGEAPFVGTYRGKDVRDMSRQELIDALVTTSRLMSDALKERTLAFDPTLPNN